MKHERVECMEIYLKSYIYSSGWVFQRQVAPLCWITGGKKRAISFCFSSPVTVPAFKRRSFLSQCSVSGDFLDLCAF